MIQEILGKIIRGMDAQSLQRSSVIYWASPVPVFGNPTTARVATVGINPSNKEFVDDNGEELEGVSRRFHTLRSLGLSKWGEARQEDLRALEDGIINYFSHCPYVAWFSQLNALTEPAGHSYFGSRATLCHIDLVPYATSRKWTCLDSSSRKHLIDSSLPTLFEIINSSDIEVLVVNGTSVVQALEAFCGIPFERIPKPEWALRRRSSRDVPGWAIEGKLRTVGNRDFARTIKVLGYNHNLQSSFGVTRQARESIGHWLRSEIEGTSS